MKSLDSREASWLSLEKADSPGRSVQGLGCRANIIPIEFQPIQEIAFARLSQRKSRVSSAEPEGLEAEDKDRRNVETCYSFICTWDMRNAKGTRN